MQKKRMKKKKKENDSPSFQKTDKKLDIYLAGVCTSIVAALYMKTLYPEVAGGDSGELITAAHEFGVAHPPGYPLFILLAQLYIHLLPFGSTAWRLNLMAATCSAATSGLLFFTMKRYTRNLSSAILVVALFSFSRLTWLWAVTAEVFGLNNFFIALLIFLLFTFNTTRQNIQKQVAYLGALVCGLSLCNQHTIVVYVVILAIWVIAKLWWSKMLHLHTTFVLGLMFMAGLIPYLYLVVSAYLNIARWTWGDQRTISGFLKHVIRAEYGTFDLGKDQRGPGFLQGLRCHLLHVWTNLTPAAPILAVLSCGLEARRLRAGYCTSVSICLVMLCVYIVVFTWRANLDVNNPLLLGVVERFWMQSDIIVAILASLTYSDMVCWLEKRYSAIRKLSLVASVAFLIYQVHRNYPLCDKSHDVVVYSYGRAVLDSLPANATVLTRGDLPSNIFRYLHLCENVRPDVKVFDQEVLTYQWSVPMMRKHHPGIIFPGDFLHFTNEEQDGQLSFNFRHFLDVNYQRGPIFSCVGIQEREPSWRTGYELWPFGSCSQFIQFDTVVDLAAWVTKTSWLGFNWTYPFEGYDPKSWEKVASDEMWNSKISSALFMYECAEESQDLHKKTHFLLHSYELYKAALDYHQTFPTFWHKNFALVCEKLLHFHHQVDKDRLLDSSITHLSLYAAAAPRDPEINNIQLAIKSLESVQKQRQNL